MNTKIIPIRELHGYGEDAYFISTNQEQIYTELKQKRIKIVQELHITDYSNKEFIFEDNERRWIAVGCKISSDVIQNMQLQHVAFFCSDIRRMEDFYTSMLGFRRVKEFDKSTDKESIILRNDNVRIKLFQSKNCDKKSDMKFKHFAISVGSLSNTINHLNNVQIPVDRIIDYSTEEKTLIICFIRDPEGNIIEFIEGYEDNI